MANFPTTAEIRVTARTPSGVWCELLHSDPAATYTLPLKAGQAVKSNQSFTQVVTACDGTGVSLTGGDGDDVDGFFDSTDAALTVAATATAPAVKLFSASGNPYAAGKVYRSDDTLDFAWDPGTSATAGRVLIYVELTSSMKHDTITP